MAASPGLSAGLGNASVVGRGTSTFACDLSKTSSGRYLSYGFVVEDSRTPVSGPNLGGDLCRGVPAAVHAFLLKGGRTTVPRLLGPVIFCVLYICGFRNAKVEQAIFSTARTSGHSLSGTPTYPFSR
jgi:hypothetical protein